MSRNRVKLVRLSLLCSKNFLQKGKKICNKKQCLCPSFLILVLSFLWKYTNNACSSFSILRLWRLAEGTEEAAVRAHLPTISVGRIQKVGRGQLMSSSHSLVFFTETINPRVVDSRLPHTYTGSMYFKELYYGALLLLFYSSKAVPMDEDQIIVMFSTYIISMIPKNNDHNRLFQFRQIVFRVFQRSKQHFQFRFF